MKVRSLIGGALGNVSHEPGDILEASANKAAEWIAAGIAEPVRRPDRDKGDG